MVLNPRFKSSSLVAGFGLALLIALSIAYYVVFASNLQFYDGEAGLFQQALNEHDHWIYVDNIERVATDGLEYELNNDLGIAAVYLALARAMPFLTEPTFAQLSLFFNIVVLIGTYLLYAAICSRLGLGVAAKFSFLANTYFVYFVQLINKDMLTVFAFLLAVWLGMKRSLWPLLVLLPLLALVRQQLVVFSLVFVFLMRAPRPQGRIAVAYVVTSIVAGLLSVFASIIGEDSLGDGFSAYLIEFNQSYVVGYLIFNPVRVLQYVVDAFASFDLMTPTGGIDTAKLLRWPQLILLVFLLPWLTQFVTRFGNWVHSPARPLMLATVAYLLAWLMNPTINARYVMLITPVLVLFALYVQRRRAWLVR